MILGDAIGDLNKLPLGGVLFVEPIEGLFQPESRAVVLELSDEELATPVASVAAIRAPGTEYFLEVALAREVLEGWLLHNPGLPANHPKSVARIIHYATHDA